MGRKWEKETVKRDMYIGEEALLLITSMKPRILKVW
jgi:hypothetical protein